MLLIFQAMDAAGKDGAIKHVMSGVNPQGCRSIAFKQPSAEELDHDFLWRSRAPPAGARADRHLQPLLLRGGAGGARPRGRAAGREAAARAGHARTSGRSAAEDIAAFERYLARQGTLILKFFLNVSKEEQKKRFLARLDEPEKNWKFSAGDVAERQYWDEYQAAYEDAIRSTAAPQAPWFVVPADHKWFTRLAVMAAITEGLRGLDLAYPKVEADDMAALEQARRMLEGE